MRDIIGRLRESPGWGLGVVASIAGLYAAVTQGDWVLGTFVVVLFICVLYILRLEAYIVDLKASE